MQPFALPATMPIVVKLRGEKGTREVTPAVGQRKLIYGSWPLKKTRRLEGDIGYLRLPSMTSDDDELYALEQAMHSFNGNAYHYKKPVTLLIDRGCYSATDIFAAAFQVLPKVTLVGEPTMGGSGRASGYVLPNSGIRLRLSSMASCRPDGVLFEGNGVVPDISIETAPTDQLGTTDTVLQRAIELLR